MRRAWRLRESQKKADAKEQASAFFVVLFRSIWDVSFASCLYCPFKEIKKRGKTNFAPMQYTSKENRASFCFCKRMPGNLCINTHLSYSGSLKSNSNNSFGVILKIIHIASIFLYWIDAVLLFIILLKFWKLMPSCLFNQYVFYSALLKFHVLLTSA